MVAGDAHLDGEVVFGEPMSPDPLRTVLFVRDSSITGRARRALLKQGWRVLRCDGPHDLNCPLAHDGICGLRDAADVTVVGMGGPEDPEIDDPLDLLRCGVGRGSPGLLVFNGYGHVVGEKVQPRRVGLRDGEELAARVTDLFEGES